MGGFRMIRKAVFIVGLSLLLGVESKKAFNKKKYNNTGIMEAKAELTVLSSVIDTLKAEVALLEECVKTPSEEACVAPPDERTSTAEVKDLMFAASQYMNTGDRCGPQQLTNCASTLNVADDSITAATITSNSATYAAAFGDADTRDWRSTGVCFIALLTNGQTVYATGRHGGSSDCIEETGWRYGVQSVHLIYGNA